MLKEQKRETLITTLMDSQPDGVLWFKPVFREGSEEVVDFEVAYCNKAASKILGTTHSEVIGSPILSSPLVDPESRNKIFGQCLQVWQTKNPLEFTYYNEGLDRYFDVQRSKVEDGILNIVRDRTYEVRLELANQELENKYQQIIDTSADGIMVLEPLKDAEDHIQDFRISCCNKAAYLLGKLPADAVGKTVLEVLPGLRGENPLQYHKQVMQSGQPFRYETAFTHPDGTHFGWFIISLTSLGSSLISRFVDITERKRYELQLEEGKQELQSIFHTSINGILAGEAVRNAEGVIEDFIITNTNKALWESLGIHPENIEGGRFLSWFPKTKKTGLFEAYCQVVNTGQPFRAETYYKAGKVNAWFDVQAAKKGKDGLLITFIDITAARQNAEKIREQKALLDNILKRSTHGVSVIEVIRDGEGTVVDGKTVLSNESGARYIGLSLEECLQKTVRGIDPALFSSPVFEMALHTLKTGNPFQTEYFFEPQKRWLELHVSKMDEDRLITLFTDITNIKEVQLQKEELLRNLQLSNERLEEFAYAASHDLQEPLRKIALYSDRLKKDWLSGFSTDTGQHLSRIDSAASRMRHLITGLLAYSQISEEAEAFKDINLDIVLHHVLQDLEAAINDSGARIEADTLPLIRGNEHQLRQLFQNLIGNALKYRKPQRQPLIAIRYRWHSKKDPAIPQFPGRDESDYHLLEIADNGIGFDQESASKIFEVFQRLHKGMDYKGTGIGLAIVQKVVTRHKGFISAHGEIDKGATFKVWLPAGQ